MLEYEIDENFIVQEEFKNPYELVKSVYTAIYNNMMKFYYPTYKTINKKEIGSYNQVGLDSYDILTVKIYGIYEEGIVYEIASHINDYISKDIILTKALLIIQKNNNPKIIISAIDGRFNENDFEHKEDYISVNEELINSIIKDLGNRIDSDIVGEIKKDNVFNKKKNEEKKILMREKTRLIVLHSLKDIDEIDNAKVKKISLK